MCIAIAKVSVINLLLFCLPEADVNYKPQPSEFAAFSSRIPVKSASKRKFDKAHEKNFSR